MLCHYQFILMAKGFAPVPPKTVSASIKKFKGTILDELKGLDDPRNKRKPNHLLSDIITIAGSPCKLIGLNLSSTFNYASQIAYYAV